MRAIQALTAFLLGLAAAPAWAQGLSHEDRVACQWRLQAIYWRHMEWPDSNPGPKPTLQGVLSPASVARQVDKTLVAERVLREDYGIEIDALMLQAEMDRMARDTRTPEMLRELFAALDDDPVKIAACLAQPLLADRLLRQAYAYDRRLHGELGDHVAQERARLRSPRDLSNAIGSVQEATLDLSDPQSETKRDYDDWLQEVMFSRRGEIAPHTSSSSGPALTLPAIRSSACSDGWTPTAVDLPDGRYQHTMVWTGTEVIVWGGSFSAPEGASAVGTGAKYDPTTDTWTYLPATINSPSRRSSHSAVWTGTEMLVWGGHINGDGFNSGSRFDPLTGTWTAMTLSGAPVGRFNVTGVWTGTEMIVWGGAGVTPALFNTGGRYDPATNSWRPTSTGANVPSPRSLHTAVWTGSRMVIWGGNDNTGGVYDPVADSWQPTLVDASTPEGRQGHTAVWTGSEMIVWGGLTITGTNTGGRYDPVENKWSATSTGAGVPLGRFLHGAVWTGSRMIIWGGRRQLFSGWIGSGGSYDPTSNTWSAIATSGEPPPSTEAAFVWTGSEMILWGGDSPSGAVRTGGRYNPSSDSWAPVNPGGTPDARTFTGGVWTGTHLIVWGGQDIDGDLVNTGGRYDPATDTWAPTSTSGAPIGRQFHGAVWTGTRMVVWGGQAGGGGAITNTGGLYDPLADAWSPTTLTGAPIARWDFPMVWTGTEAVLWGGNPNGTNTNTGGLYNPATDTWKATSTGPGVPEGRYRHTAVWTGTHMIVWGGSTLSANRVNTGGRYDPVSDTWAPTSLVNVPLGRRNHAAVWTGSEMIVWGGTEEGPPPAPTGAIYDPVADAWRPISTVGQPTVRSKPAHVWTGTDMLVWGGVSDTRAGGRYFPSTDNWVSTPLDDAPIGTASMAWAWDDAGDRFFAWGGVHNSSTQMVSTGGVLCACAAAPWYPDLDSDGHGVPSGALQACAQPAGYAPAADDCDDSLASRFPGNAEVCDGIDNDCNLVLDDAPMPGAASVLAAKSGATILLDWTVVPGASAYDVTRGGVSALRTSDGDFSTSTQACVVEDAASPGASDAEVPLPGDGFWYTTRSGNCGGPGSYDEAGGSGQQGSRDGEIGASGLGCP